MDCMAVMLDGACHLQRALVVAVFFVGIIFNNCFPGTHQRIQFYFLSLFFCYLLSIYLFLNVIILYNNLNQNPAASMASSDVPTTTKGRVRSVFKFVVFVCGEIRFCK